MRPKTPAEGLEARLRSYVVCDEAPDGIIHEAADMIRAMARELATLRPEAA